jgi:hypothetical protein
MRLSQMRGRVESVINPMLWTKAQWCATAFGLQTSDAPPILGLVFKDRGAALAIFTDWRDRFGEVDADERIRVSILTGVNRHRPTRYRVAVGSNIEAMQLNQLIVTASRIQAMDPSDSKNLDAFCEAYAFAGRYVLAPAILANRPGTPDFLLEKWIGKRSLTIRPLWQVGEDDADLPAVRPGDEPVMPEEQVDPPVCHVLARMQGTGVQPDRPGFTRCDVPSVS